jgi:hypothetical protein
MNAIKTTLLLTALAMLILGAGCEREIVNAAAESENQDCFVCHGEDGLLLAAKGEWQNSVHASGNNVDYTNRGGGDDCTKCHDHQGFLDFLATGELNGPFENVSAIHCFTCHAPHTRGDLTLRTVAAYTLENGAIFDHTGANLCANCHHARYSADNITANQEVHRYWGPHHGPQSDLLIGTNGYEYAGLGYDYGSTGHASVGTDNGCIKCHMGNPETHLGYRLGGHSFNMTHPDDPEETLVGICEQCHPTAEDYDYDSIQTYVHIMLDSLEELLLTAGHIDTTGHPLGLPYGPGPHTIPDEGEAGAVYNFLIVEEDRSFGVHNPEYIVDLLESSIEYMEGRLAGKAGREGGIAGLTIRPHTTH